MATRTGTGLLLLLVLLEGSVCHAGVSASASDATNHHQTHSDDSGSVHQKKAFPVLNINYAHVRVLFEVSLWVLLASVMKLVIGASHHVTNVILERALLICFGMVRGAIKDQTFSPPPTVFFLYLLPQIILDRAYFMPKKQFFSNLGGILIHGVIGTCFYSAAVGLSLWRCHMGGAMGDIDIDLRQYLLFGSLISAVDLVAVNELFEQGHVNGVLFIMVLGESLLNNGVTVVLFNVFDAFVSLGGANINAVEIIKGIASFFVAVFGGSLVGVVFGILVSLLTRWTEYRWTIEPLFVFLLGYLSYLTAEMFSLSAVLSIMFYGVFCQKYIDANMDERSVTAVRYFMKFFAKRFETMILIFLGISAIDETIWVWNTSFILLTLLFVFVYRFIGVFFLTTQVRKNTQEEQVQAGAAGLHGPDHHELRRHAGGGGVRTRCVVGRGKSQRKTPDDRDHSDRGVLHCCFTVIGANHHVTNVIPEMRCPPVTWGAS